MLRPNGLPISHAARLDREGSRAEIWFQIAAILLPLRAYLRQV